MPLYRVECVEKGYLLGDLIERRETFWGRATGLMLHSRLSEGEGLWLKNVASIHMCFMRFPIDAVFIGDRGNVVMTFEVLKPWIGLARAPARDVIELPAGTIQRTGCASGDRLQITLVGPD